MATSVMLRRTRDSGAWWAQSQFRMDHDDDLAQHHIIANRNALIRDSTQSSPQEPCTVPTSQA